MGAGIGVGVPLIAGAALFFILARRRRQLKPAEQLPDSGVGSGEERFEAPGTLPEMTSELGVEAKGREPAELEANMVINKGDREQHELATPETYK